MPETIEIKRGDTYSLDDQLVIDDGLNTPFPLTGYTLRSHVRDASKALITTCTCTVTNALLGTYKVSCTPIDTATWVVGQLFTDIEFTAADGFKFSTETFTINVIEDQTI
jgi:hypothetical protein